MLYLRGVVCSRIVGERLRVTPTSHVGTNDSEKVFCTIARISKRKFEQKKYGQFNTKKHMSYQLPKKSAAYSRCVSTKEPLRSLPREPRSRRQAPVTSAKLGRRPPHFFPLLSPPPYRICCRGHCPRQRSAKEKRKPKTTRSSPLSRPSPTKPTSSETATNPPLPSPEHFRRRRRWKDKEPTKKLEAGLELLPPTLPLSLLRRCSRRRRHKVAPRRRRFEKPKTARKV